ncbi:MAG: hypothetical protein Q9201_002785 [Fulgogasparrea decipioides]
MDGLHKTFYRVQHGDSCVLYDAQTGFEARSHYMMTDCYYINKRTIEAHLDPKNVLTPHMSPYISVFDDYSESSNLVEVSGLRLANDVVDDALEQARSHCRQGCKEVIIAEIDASALRLDVLDIIFPNQTVKVPVWQTAERDSFFSVPDLRSAFKVDISLGQESEWLALDFIPKHLITNVERRVVCGNVEPLSKTRKHGITSMPPPPKKTRMSEESSAKGSPLNWEPPLLHYKSPYNHEPGELSAKGPPLKWEPPPLHYKSPYSPYNPEPGKAFSRPPVKRPAAPCQVPQKPFSFLEARKSSAKGPALGLMATPPPANQKPSRTHKPKKARAKGSSWRIITKEESQLLAGVRDSQLYTNLMRMHASLPTKTMMDCRDALMKHKGNLDDAISYLDPDYSDSPPADSAPPSPSQSPTQQILPAGAKHAAMQLLAAPPPTQQQPPSIAQVEETTTRARPLKRKAPPSPARPKPQKGPKPKKALSRRPALAAPSAAQQKTRSDPEPGQAPVKAAVKKWMHDPKSTMQTKSPPKGSELNPVLLD